MTTGTKTSGALTPYPGDTSLTSKVGRVIIKTWNGADSPKGTRRENAYTMTKSSEGYIPVKYERLNNIGQSYSPPTIKTDSSSYIYGKPSGGSEPWSANDDITLFNKLASKVRTHEFNAGAFLGEGHQTLSSIGDTAKNIALSLRDVRRGRFKQAISKLTGVPDPSVPSGMRYWNLTRNMSHNWLKLQYGWLPLLGDAKAGAEALASQFHKPVSNTYRASLRRTNSGTRVANSSCSHSWLRTRVKRVKVTMASEEGTSASLGLTDPFSIAWELVPWSFVIDWFAPIGPWLEAHGKLRSMSFKSVVTTNFNENTWKILHGGTYVLGYKPISEPPSNEFRTVSLVRSVATVYPSLPLPSIKPLSESLSFKHALNGLALLGSGIR